MIAQANIILKERTDLPLDLMRIVMEEILDGKCQTAEIADFLQGLAVKGETVDELSTAVSVMLEHIDQPILFENAHFLDTCGTGGDKKNTFNISTVAAFVAAGAGVTVAKHGNRSVSGICGSADLLESLGVNIRVSRDVIKRCLQEAGIAFLFAPDFHPALRYVTAARKMIAGRTMFNVLGPLVNPARAMYQLVGVFSPDWGRKIASVFGKLGKKHVVVVCGQDGLDEASLNGPTSVFEYRNNELTEYSFVPEDYGFNRGSFSALHVNGVSESCRIALDILNGLQGPCRDIVLLNAGCALYAADHALSIHQGIEMARNSLDSKAALKKLELLKSLAKG